MLTRISTAVVAAALASGCGSLSYYPGSSYGGGGGYGNGSGSQPPAETLAGAGAGHKLTRVTSDDVNETLPRLSPDGEKLLLVAFVNAYDEQGYEDGYEKRVLVGVSPANGARRTLYTSDRSQSYGATWHPNGKSFLYVSNSMGRWNLLRSLSRSPNAAASVVVSEDVAPEMGGVSVASDGKRVAFHTLIRDEWMIAIADLDGGNFTMLAEGAWPTWSPDGTQLAFHRRVGGINQIFLIDVETGANLVQLTNDDSHSEQPVWSPDGTHVAFVTNRGWNQFLNGTEKSVWNLFAIRSDGTGLTQLTSGARSVTTPCWGADGWIYFASNEAGNYDIWRIEPTFESVANASDQP